jgi:hypothetical protein
MRRKVLKRRRRRRKMNLQSPIVKDFKLAKFLLIFLKLFLKMHTQTHHITTPILEISIKSKMKKTIKWKCYKQNDYLVKNLDENKCQFL